MQQNYMKKLPINMRKHQKIMMKYIQIMIHIKKQLKLIEKQQNNIEITSNNMITIIRINQVQIGLEIIIIVIINLVQKLLLKNKRLIIPVSLYKINNHKKNCKMSMKIFKIVKKIYD